MKPESCMLFTRLLPDTEDDERILYNGFDCEDIDNRFNRI